MKKMTVLQMILAGVAVCSLGLYCAATLPQLYRTQFDDAYMFLRYAKHWAVRYGLLLESK